MEFLKYPFIGCPIKQDEKVLNKPEEKNGGWEESSETVEKASHRGDQACPRPFLFKRGHYGKIDESAVIRLKDLLSKTVGLIG